MKERPILFSGPMVRAIRDGRKMQTRRIVTPQPEVVCSDPMGVMYLFGRQCEARMAIARCPYGAPGDRLWVRETWATYEVNDPVKPSALPHDSRVFYRADGANTGTWLSGQWRPSSNMPRWASRLTLAIEAVRVERLQEISEDDARAEGVDWASPEYLPPDDGDREDPREVGYPSAAASFARDNFRRLWDSLNGKRAPWASNPWVWAITFRVLS